MSKYTNGELIEDLSSWVIWADNELKKNDCLNLQKDETLELIDMLKEVIKKLRGGETK